MAETNAFILKYKIIYGLSLQKSYGIGFPYRTFLFHVSPHYHSTLVKK